MQTPDAVRASPVHPVTRSHHFRLAANRGAAAAGGAKRVRRHCPLHRSLQLLGVGGGPERQHLDRLQVQLQLLHLTSLAWVGLPGAGPASRPDPARAASRNGGGQGGMIRHPQESSSRARVPVRRQSSLPLPHPGREDVSGGVVANPYLRFASHYIEMSVWSTILIRSHSAILLIPNPTVQRALGFLQNGNARSSQATVDTRSKTRLSHTGSTGSTVLIFTVDPVDPV